LAQSRRRVRHPEIDLVARPNVRSSRNALNGRPEPFPSPMMWFVHADDLVFQQEIIEHDHKMLVIGCRGVSGASQMKSFAIDTFADLMKRHDLASSVIPDQQLAF
jgi:hypothetical protein